MYLLDLTIYVLIQDVLCLLHVLLRVLRLLICFELVQIYVWDALFRIVDNMIKLGKKEILEAFFFVLELSSCINHQPGKKEKKKKEEE